MSTLALLGGEPIRRKSWPDWPIHSEVEKERLLQALTSRHWNENGPMEQAFAEAFATFNGVGHCMTTNTGTSSLLIALEALDIGAGDEVIVPSLTWTATATVVVEVNAIPILVDIEPDTYCLDLDQVEAAITPRTRAVIPVHLYCCMVDMDRLLSVARKYGLSVIEDCAHVHGTLWKGLAAGSIGDVGAYSMQQGKVLTCGNGGAAVTNDIRLAARLDMLRTNGRRQSASGLIEDGDPIGSNYRLTEFQAAILLSQLERLEKQNQQREASAQHLDGQLSQIPGIKPMRRREQISRQTYYYYVIRYNSSFFAGRPVDVIRRALSAELNLTVARPYRPLNDNALFRPTTKRRFNLGESHWEALNPGRFKTPVAARAFHDEAILFHHSLLLAERSELRDVALAFEKVSEQAATLPLT